MISVIMSTFNEELSVIEKSIVSVLEQTYSDFEFIILNDNPTRTELGVFLNQFAEKDQRIRYFQNDRNIGLVKSLNKGLEFAKGDYIARMDADDISAERRLEWQFDYLLKNALDIVGGSVEKIDEEENSLGVLKVPCDHKQIIKYQKYGSCVLHPTWLVKRSVYETLGGYREIYSCEDYDFLLRAIQSGCKIGNVPKVVLKYRVRTGGISVSNDAKQKIMTYYLAARMNRIQEVTLEMINEYTASKEYSEEIKKLEAYNVKKEMIKSSQKGIASRSAALGGMLLNRYFYLDLNQYLMRKWRSLFSKVGN